MFSWLLLLLFCALCLLFTHLKTTRRGKTESYGDGSRRPRLPPGPPGLPIIGNLHMIGKLPHRDLARLANVHGPIMHMKLGAVPAVVITSPSIAEQVLKTHDVIFANRPPYEIVSHLSYGFKGFGFTAHGAQWRALRKLCITGLMSTARIEAFRYVREEELDHLVNNLNEAVAAHAPIKLNAAVGALMADIVCRMVLGRKFVEDSVEGVKFSEHIEEILKLLVAFNVNDYIPFVAWLDIQGLRRRTKKVRKVLDRFLEKIIDQHIEDEGRGRKHDFIDFLLSKKESKDMEFEMDRTTVKAVVMDVLEGAMDSTHSVVEWAFSELLRHPRVMKKVQQELESVVGTHRVVEESDLNELHYLEMVVKETLRVHPLSVFLFHYNKEECVVSGFRIPARSYVFVNAWAIGRDPEAWPDAEEFLPERFADEDINIRGLDYRLLPFGSGRRMCPGINFGLTMIPLILARLLHCFDWELPYGMSPSELDMMEKFGLSASRASPLWVIPKHRKHDKEK